jgi:hypothetical protein
MGVCFENDAFVNAGENTIWIAELSDGSVVYQDDYRPCEAEPSAWLRLCEYCRQNNLGVRKFYLQFRSHVENIELDGERLFWIKGLRRGSGTVEKHQYVTGVVKNGVLERTWWRIPELYPHDHDVLDKWYEFNTIRIVKGDLPKVEVRVNG